jgi:hypothetical protein
MTAPDIHVADDGTTTHTSRAREAYVEATDCPICPMVATDRDDALNEAAALQRRCDAFATDVVWRANWMTRAVNLLGALRDLVHAEFPEHLDELEQLLQDEFDDGDGDDDE